MINVLMFGMSSYPGGIESYIVNTFCNEKMSTKVHIDFVTYESKLAYEDEIYKCGYNIIFTPHLKKNPMGYWKCIKNAMKVSTYDCVYVNMLTAANILPVKLAKKAGVKKIIIHAHANSTINGFARRVLHKVNSKFCNEVATLRLACSRAAAEWLYDEKIGTSPILVIPNAIDTKRFSYSEQARVKIREQYGVAEDELLLGSIGRFGPEKNNLFMIDILQGLRKKKFSAKLLLVGDGALKEQIIEKARAAGVREYVIFAGTRTNTEEYYSAFDAFLFPSQFEGFGISALEAQSCGVPCLCSDRLSKELNVSGTVIFLPIHRGRDCWVDAVEQIKKNTDKISMNKKIENSGYSVSRQNIKMLELLLN